MFFDDLVFHASCGFQVLCNLQPHLNNTLFCLLTQSFRLYPDFLHAFGDAFRLKNDLGISLCKGLDISLRIPAEGLHQFATGLVHRHLLVVAQRLEFIERGTDHDGDIVGDLRKTVLERLLKQHLTIWRGTEAPHHRGTRLTGTDTGCHCTLSCIV